MSNPDNDQESIEKLDSEVTSFIDTFVKYDNEILSVKDKINSCFISIFKEDREIKVFNELGNELTTVFVSVIPEEAREDVINAVYSLVLNFEAGSFDYLQDKTGNDELIQFVVGLRTKFGLDFKKETNKFFRGERWWSDLKTNMGYRSGQVYFDNEVVVAMEDRMNFTSDLHGQVILSMHFIEQITQAQNQLGESIIEDINKSAVEDLEESISDLLKDIEDYEEKYDVDLYENNQVDIVTE
ncbi:hypothetical protein [Natronorubrum halophilum]|uniref:hypothetical protein n=1 Tax=Natronorubrum halophilum TaxID=1702106 RepID=UPI0010C23B5F|nr:hypothetical protein [Natronorubrum halophilum]